MWNPAILNALRSHFSLRFPDTLSHTLSELPEFQAKQMFAHEKLQVYGKALDFAAKATAWTSTWDKKHTLMDHLSRATERIALNLAEAARQRGISAMVAGF